MTQSTPSAFSRRAPFYRDVNEPTWRDWLWQQRAQIKIVSQFEDIFPGFGASYGSYASRWSDRSLRFALTPYMLSLVKTGSDGLPLKNDPIFRQFYPAFDELVQLATERPRQDEYSPSTDNWEHAGEMLTPICHWKYDNRAIIYSSDICMAYCTYCLRSLQSDAKEEKHGGLPHWSRTVEALQAHPEIEEVILSGGDPLAYPNTRLAAMLQDLRSIPSIRALSINTRAFTHNPYRIDDELCAIFKRFSVTKLGIHVVHSAEISLEFLEAVDRLHDKCGKTLLMSQHVLVKGVNDDADVLRRLFMDLFVAGVKPYAFLHNMPNIPAAASQRTSVRRAVQLFNKLKRHISNMAMPELTVVHDSGKTTVPLEIDGTPNFQYMVGSDEHPIVRLRNWRGQVVDYLDGID